MRKNKGESDDAGQINQMCAWALYTITDKQQHQPRVGVHMIYVVVHAGLCMQNVHDTSFFVGDV